MPTGVPDAEDQIHFLRNAVMGQPWARIPIGSIVTSGYSFDRFGTNLREQLQIEKQLQSPTPTSTATLFQQYGRHPK